MLVCAGHLVLVKSQLVSLLTSLRVKLVGFAQAQRVRMPMGWESKKLIDEK